MEEVFLHNRVFVCKRNKAHSPVWSDPLLLVGGPDWFFLTGLPNKSFLLCYACDCFLPHHRMRALLYRHTDPTENLLLTLVIKTILQRHYLEVFFAGVYFHSQKLKWN